MIKTLLFQCVCHDCRYIFTYPDDPDLYITRFLMTNNGLHYALINCDDPFFIEVQNLVQDFVKSEKPQRDYYWIFDKVLGLLCDVAEDGTFYDMSCEIKCRNCNSRNVSFGPTEPPEYTTISPPYVTHSNWDMLDEEQKKSKIISLIKSLLVIREYFSS